MKTQLNIKKIFNLISLFHKKPKFKQQLLIELALKEKGFNLRQLNIRCNHILGINYINDIELGIKYPDSFFTEAVKLISIKKIDFYFNGNMDDSGLRRQMLEPFMQKNNSYIIASNEGRIQKNKDKFNYSYFTELAQAKFGLCPHQADWIGDKNHVWTYRFIECCFVEAIPILFKKTPLGELFIKDFHFIWDDEISDNKIIYNPVKARENRILAQQIFCLTEEECLRIEKSLKR
jgi:hypothetical protein